MSQQQRVYRHIQVGEFGDVTIVKFLDRKILDMAKIQEIGDELFGLLEGTDRRKFIFSFSAVEFLASAMLNKFILFDRAMRKRGGAFKCCSLKPEIEEVFIITRLNQMFDLCEEEMDALSSF